MAVLPLRTTAPFAAVTVSATVASAFLYSAPAFTSKFSVSPERRSSTNCRVFPPLGSAGRPQGIEACLDAGLQDHDHLDRCSGRAYGGWPGLSGRWQAQRRGMRLSLTAGHLAHPRAHPVVAGGEAGFDADAPRAFHERATRREAAGDLDRVGGLDGDGAAVHDPALLVLEVNLKYTRVRRRLVPTAAPDLVAARARERGPAPLQPDHQDPVAGHRCIQPDLELGRRGEVESARGVAGALDGAGDLDVSLPRPGLGSGRTAAAEQDQQNSGQRYDLGHGYHLSCGESQGEPTLHN